MLRLLPCTLLLLAACSRPPAPEKERPPEPQATGSHTGREDAISAPLDRASRVGDLPGQDPAGRDAASQAAGA